MHPVGARLGGAFNSVTHRLMTGFLGTMLRRPANHWRARLDLPPLNARWPYDRLRGKPLLTLYAHSPAVLPRPADWGAHQHVTGYWWLDRLPDWQPPAALLDFLAAGPPPVYVGFGSMSSRQPERIAEIVLAALERAGVRGVLATGWGGLAWHDLPDSVYLLRDCPHDWLFPRMAAVMHHGGAGTTGAGLRAGVPSILVPFFGDQPFWGQRVLALGVGPQPIPRARLSVERLAYALRIATTHEPLRARALALGARLRAEDGVGTAVRLIERALS